MIKLMGYAGALAGLLFSASASAQVDVTVGGDVAQTAFTSRYVLKTAKSGNVEYLADPAGSGKTVLRLTVRDGETVGGIRRTDFYPNNEVLSSGLRWYGISVYIPSSWTVHPNPAVIAQIDTNTAGTAALGAPLAMLVRGSTLELNLNANYRQSTDPVLPSPSNNVSEVIKLGPLVTDRWYCLVARSEWSPSLGTGAITLWLNGEKIYKAENSTNSYFGAAHVPRAGLSFPGVMGVTQRSIYSDFLRLGGANTTVLQMYAVSPCSRAVTGPTIQW